jgi:hypothetical protein
VHAGAQRMELRGIVLFVLLDLVPVAVLPAI